MQFTDYSLETRLFSGSDNPNLLVGTSMNSSLITQHYRRSTASVTRNPKIVLSSTPPTKPTNMSTSSYPEANECLTDREIAY